MVSINYFQKVLLKNFIVATYANWLENFSFVYFLQIEGYGKYSFQKELVIDLSAEWFKTAGLRKPIARIQCQNLLNKFIYLIK